MKIHDEHTGCQITLKMDDKETIWKTEQWDCDATQLIQAFAGLMISQTFLPTTVWSCMKEEAEDQMRFLKTDELESKIESLEIEREFLEETVKKLEAQLREALKEDQEKLKEDDPGLLMPKKNLLDPKENCDVEVECCEVECCEVEEEAPMRDSIVKVGPYTDHYEEYDTGEGIPDTEPVEEG